jgi:PAS domain S-box-containing protein
MADELKILIVEDAPSDAELMEDELRRAEFVFSSLRVETEASLLQALNEFQPDLVLSDYHLPRFDGMGALAVTRRYNPFLPFILVTGPTNEEIAVACLKAGADDYLLKDRLGRLPAAVTTVLEERRNQQEKARAEEALRKRMEELAVLNLLGRRTSLSLSLEEVVQEVASLIHEAIRPDRLLLFLPLGEQMVLRCVRPEGETVVIPEQKLGECLCSKVAREGTPFYSRDIRKDPRYTWKECIETGLISFAILPMQFGTAIVGVICLASKSEREFAEQSGFLETITSQAAVGIRNAQLFEQTQHHLQELATVHEAGQHLRNIHTPERLAREVIQALERVIGYDHGAVFLLDRETGHLIPFAVSDLGEGAGFAERYKQYILNQQPRLGKGITGWVAEQGRSVRLGDVREDDRYWAIRDDIQSELCVPLIVGKSIIGVVNVETTLPEAYSEADQRVLETVAAWIAIAIQNARLFEGAQREISERKRTEMALQRSEETYRELVENLNDVIFRVDPEGRITYISPAVESLLGYSQEEVLDHSFIDFAHPEDRDRLLNSFRTVLARQMYANEYRLRQKTGGIRWVRTSSRPVIESGKAVGLQGVLTDITRQRQISDALQHSLHEKEVLLKELHHRVKNNLQVICSLLNLQARKIEDPSTREMFSESQNRVKSMALIHEMLYQSEDFGRIRFAGYIQKLVAYLCRFYRIDPDSIRIRVSVPELTMPLDLAIPCGLLIQELVSNAMKHAFPGERPGEIRVLFHPNGRDRVCLTVEDDGVGIPPQIDFPDAGSLGLQLVVSLSAQLDGEVSLERTPGTKFQITFPLEEAGMPPSGKSESAPQE